MRFAVIERFPSLEEAQLVVHPGTGRTKLFVDKEEAIEESNQCQDGLVVRIDE